LISNGLLQNTISKDGWKGRENEEDDVSRYWMTLRKREYVVNLKGKH
jgi:hypothetical protein